MYLRQKNLQKEPRRAPYARKNVAFALGTWRQCRYAYHNAAHSPQNQARQVYARHSAHNGYPGMRYLSAFPFWSSLICAKVTKHHLLRRVIFTNRTLAQIHK